MRWRPAVLAAAVLLAWELVVRVLHVADYLVPAPSTVFSGMWTQREYLWQNIGPTAYEIWTGFALAVLIGLGLGLLVSLTRFGDEAVMPLLVATQSVPKTALGPVFVVWFGYGSLPKVVMAGALAFFPIVVNLVRGLRAVEPEMVQYLVTLGASRLDVVWRLRLPAALPYLLSAMKVAISLATVGAIVGEFLGASEGLGYVMLQASNSYDTSTLFAALVVTSVIGVVSYSVISLIERLTLGWQPAALASAA
ncbi:ABC transporter permease [Dactylosporangium sp. CA-233914]|uniref:ABC transporter permease n=1 Tax=Dactylosporangium sp. CA-233914 TaxID=3239934 RepID=UPI003D8DEB94